MFTEFGSALQVVFPMSRETATFVSEKGTLSSKILSSRLKSEYLNYQATWVPQLIFLPYPHTSLRKATMI